MRHFLPAAAHSRRDFLYAAGAAAALSLIGVPAHGALARPLACRLASYGKFQDAAWAHLPSIGVKHLFLSVPAPDQLEPTMARLAAHSLTPLVVRGDADLSSAACLDALTVQLAACKTMGVHYMFLSPKHASAPKDTAIAYLRQAGDIAKEHGVTISLETHPDLGTNGDVHVETMTALDHPNVRVNFDTGNITYYNRDRNAVDELKKAVDYVATVEVKEHNGALESWTFPPLGKGIVDFRGVFAVLDAHGYAGPVTLEFEGTKGVELNEAQTKAAIEESVRYLRSVGTFV
ncbi:MAG: sugar phosphate isomerase/epimerase [Candidatus Hydrogenedentes bacterium]|nr:sugar phosphate isomerase/epimerase [Candidatus Hydrogenedentota bacterium]